MAAEDAASGGTRVGVGVSDPELVGGARGVALTVGLPVGVAMNVGLAVLENDGGGVIDTECVSVTDIVGGLVGVRHAWGPQEACKPGRDPHLKGEA